MSIFRSWRRLGKIRVLFEKDFSDFDWEVHGNHYLAKLLAEHFKDELIGKVRNQLVAEFDEKVVHQLALEYLKNFDFKVAVEEGMRDRIKEWIRRGAGP